MVLRVLENFAGIGTQRMALENLGIDHEVVGITEIDKFAIKSYEAVHGEVNNLGDISKVDPNDVPDHDLFTYSFPCFAEGTMILTNQGYKDIIDINIGDLVLTHTGQYKRVVKLFNQGKKEIVKYTGSTGEIVTTKNHKFRVKSKLANSRGLELGESVWKPIGELTDNDYVGLAINQESRLPVYTEKNVTDNFDNPSFWWMVGRYIADGCINYIDKNGKLTNNGLFISVGYNNDLDNVRNHLSNIGGLGKFSENNVKDTVQFITYNKDLINYLKQFGRYAHNKKLTGDIINLPINLAKSFLDGYESGDGWYNVNSGEMSITSTSKELLLGIGQLVMKTKNVPYRLYFNEVPKKKIIEGREVNQRDFWILRYIENPKKKTYSYDGLNIWIKFKGIVEIGEDFVYDIEVEDDHSFTASNLVVKNCQDISVAGKGRGFEKGSGTRSGLLWECEKVIEAKKPKYLLMENVKNLVSKKFMPGFQEWLLALEGMGYTNYWKVLNAKDFGIPQNRERVFCVSILGEHDPYEFPEPTELNLRLLDLLEDEVEEKYYLSEEIQKRFVYQPSFNTDIKRLGTTSPDATIGQRDIVYSSSGILGSLTATDYKQPKQVGEATDVNSEGKLLVKNATKKGYIEATEGDGIDLSFPDSKTRRGRVQKQTSQTLDTGDSKGVVENMRIRKLTPKECWRLMGVSDEDFAKARLVNSDTQLYKQAGNAIVVNVLEALFANMLK